MRNAKKWLAIGMISILTTGICGGCSALTSTTSTDGNVLDGYNPNGRLGDDSTHFDNDAFMQGFSGSPEN